MVRRQPEMVRNAQDEVGKWSRNDLKWSEMAGKWPETTNRWWEMVLSWSERDSLSDGLRVWMRSGNLREMPGNRSEVAGKCWANGRKMACDRLGCCKNVSRMAKKRSSIGGNCWRIVAGEPAEWSLIEGAWPVKGKNRRWVDGKRYEMVGELETACNGLEMIGKRPEMGRIVKCYEYPGMSLRLSKWCYCQK